MTPHEIVARRVARRYSRRVWWASEQDLVQQALLAVHQASRTFDPSIGIPFGSYASRAAVNALRMMLWKDSAPVSAPWHKVTELRGLHRAALTVSLPEDTPSPDVIIGHELWLGKVTNAIRAIVSNRMALAVILDEEKPADVAERHGVEVTQVYSATLQAKRKLRQDFALWQLWKDE